ncbi:hypothetical protein [Streptomyces niveus]|uniref:hypothetical protein n=1 Tax=Streptomyces niveus TaxID=193462 RepID=UPI0003C5CE64|nr:hypothetical protein [Streptomyces niveus]EST31647.1 hypothetical protein M877_06620 [Streptomyces niveus NCIMB 11891]
MTTSSQNPNLPSREAHQLYLRQLATYLRESKQIMDAWDVYSDNHCDPVTFEPFDEAAYGIRQRQRDTDTLNAFGRVYFHADVLVDIAEHQLARLPASATRDFAWRLGELRTSTERLYELHRQWLDLRASLPTDAVPGTVAYDEPLAESRADAWHHLDQWGIHGQALIDINTQAQKQARQHRSSEAPVKAPPPPDAAPTTPPARK